MPETLAERISKKYGNRQIVTDAIRDFVREVAGQIRAEKIVRIGHLADGAHNRGLEKSAKIIERAAGGEG